MRGVARLLLVIVSPMMLGSTCAQDFDLGVGSFEIEPERAILWTHVVPVDPATKTVKVRLFVASDPDFQHIVRMQAASAKADDDFTVRVLVPGLHSSTRYYYRFTAVASSNSSISSPVGTFRT